MSLINNALGIIEGFGPSYQFTEFYNKQQEIQQGGNYYLGALPLMAQMTMVDQMISRIANVFEDCILKRTANFLSTAVTIAFVPFSLFCAAVKQGEYGKLAAIANKHLNIFPEKISEISTKVFSFVSEQGDKVLFTAMVVSSVALLVLGQYVFATTCLSILAYNALDEAG
ncbi:MAG TPA: hypothetical protein VIH61_02265, partial [Waddliaceae bacterium]